MRRVAIAFAWALSACSSESGDVCAPEDADGIEGGSYEFVVHVDAAAFSPPILKTQDLSTVTLTLVNDDDRPRGFFVECLPTPNPDGCPEESCFPDEAVISPIDPGTEATAVFDVPRVEGLYVIRSLADEEPTAQFIVQ